MLSIGLQCIGDWMKINSAAIYATQACPIADVPDGVYTTRKGNHV